MSADTAGFIFSLMTTMNRLVICLQSHLIYAVARLRTRYPVVFMLKHGCLSQYRSFEKNVFSMFSQVFRHNLRRKSITCFESLFYGSKYMIFKSVQPLEQSTLTADTCDIHMAEFMTAYCIEWVAYLCPVGGKRVYINRCRGFARDCSCRG